MLNIEDHDDRFCYWHIQNQFPSPDNWSDPQIYADGHELEFILNALVGDEHQIWWDMGSVSGRGMTWSPIDCDTHQLLKILKSYHEYLKNG